MTALDDNDWSSSSDDRQIDAVQRQVFETDAPSPSPPGEETETVRDSPICATQRIGQYHIKRVIASGGMGTVYEATQERPRRTVALKLMKHGIASRSALRRFEYESQILARLRHPGIAQVYEAGTHRDDTGSTPYFAMEYIPNALAVTKYAKEKKLGARQRMELFAQVCDAVHHGHQKGIIHRDLKPSNILVDSGGQVKIIDFGVARSTDSDLAVTTLQTDVGQLIGTLQYMSPEQCAADPHDIDTRSDVYALGVVFYELLCGRLPYDVTRTAMHEATRIIREQQPTRLSTLNKTLRGDVETIALKALEKERDRRYQSAFELGQDIRRYLAGEAIIARRAGVLYQFKVLVRRNKAVFGTIAAMFVVLLGAVIVSASLYVRAERARRGVLEARIIAQKALQGRYYWNQRNEESLKKSIEYFEQAVAKDPTYALAHAALAESYVAMAGHNLMAPSDALQKAKESALRAIALDATIGEAHTALGAYLGSYEWNWPGALTEFETAIRLNPGHATTHQWYAEILMGVGRVEESLAEIKHAEELDPLSLPIKVTRALLHYLSRQYDSAIASCRAILELEPEYVFPRRCLALAYVKVGEFDLALNELQTAMKASERSPVLVAALGYAHAAAGDSDEVRRVLDELGQIAQKRYVSAYLWVPIYVALSDLDSAFYYLERAYESRAADLRHVMVDPALDAVRTDDRFNELVARMGFVP